MSVYDEFINYLKSTNNYQSMISYIDLLYDKYSEIYPINKDDIFNSMKNIKLKDLKLILLFNSVPKNKYANGYGIGLNKKCNGCGLKLKNLNTELKNEKFKEFDKSLDNLSCKGIMPLSVIFVLCADEFLKDKFIGIFTNFLEFINKNKIVIVLNTTGNYEKIIEKFDNIYSISDTKNVFKNINHILKEFGYKEIDFK